MISVAIIEDNIALGAALKKIVNDMTGCECCGVWHTAEEALKAIPIYQPQVALMDIHLPGMDGIQATRELKARIPTLQIVILTVHRDHDKIFNALEAGASGYLLKRDSWADLSHSIKEVLAGGAPMSPEIARRVIAMLNQPAKTPEPSKTPLPLSAREIEVLELICKGLGNKEIADKLNVSTETIRSHLKRIYEKLHVHSRTEAAMVYKSK
jgi:DNA-binding NarL/FixJ family response regulator